jgi:hypothetical protein
MVYISPTQRPTAERRNVSGTGILQQIFKLIAKLRLFYKRQPCESKRYSVEMIF